MKREDNVSTNILFILLLIPVIWIALLVAPYIEGGIPNILKNVNTIIENPMQVNWCEDTVKCIFIFLLTYALGVGIIISTRKKL